MLSDQGKDKRTATLTDKQNSVKPGDPVIARRRRTLWVVFFVVLVPFIGLLVLQWHWLKDLNEHKVKARKVRMEALLRNALDNMTEFVELKYSKEAALTLNVPVDVLRGPKYKRRMFFLKRKKHLSEAKYLFMVQFKENMAEDIFFYDPHNEVEVEPFDLDLLYWRIMAKLEKTFDKTELRVNESDPEQPIILHPIVDESTRLIGVAGMVVNSQSFEKSVLRELWERYLPKAPKGNETYLKVLNANGEKVLGCVPEKAEYSAAKNFTFVFTKWKLVLGNRSYTPEDWAQFNFAYNISISLGLFLTLFGGLTWALRTTNRELKLSEMKNDFVSNVSHELRTPLSSIRVFGELLRRGRAVAPDKIQEYGEYIETESRRLGRLIENILDFAKIESGKKVYQFTENPLEETIEHVLQLFAVRLIHCGIKVDYFPPEEPLPHLIFDADAISQAISNLIENAVKYSGENKRIKVVIERKDPFVEVGVTDFGIGISREEQKRIFERFHRVSTGLVHDVKGCGLGLSIVQHIVHAHGGSIRVNSVVSKGSTFVISLPIGELPGDEPSSTEGKEQGL